MSDSLSINGAASSAYVIPPDFRQPSHAGEWAVTNRRRVRREHELRTPRPDEGSYLTAAVMTVLAEAYEQDGWSLDYCDRRERSTTEFISLTVRTTQKTMRGLVADIEQQLSTSAASVIDHRRAGHGSNVRLVVMDEGDSTEWSCRGQGGTDSSLAIIVLRVGPDALTVSVGYSPACHEHDLMELLVAALADGLGLLSAHPDSDTYDVLSAARSEPAAPTRKAERSPESASVAAQFSDVVNGLPEQVAIRYGSTEITYSQLDHAASHFLSVMAASPAVGDRVLFYSHSSAELVAAMLAAARGGISFTVVSPNEPASRISEMVKALDMPAIFVITPGHSDGFDAKSAVAKLSPGAAKFDITLIEGSLSEWGPTRSAHAEATKTPGQSVELYTVFTSGSTGVPKGISMTAGSFSQLNSEFIRRFGLGPHSSIPLWAPASYDASYYEIFGALLSGATLLIPLAADRANDTSALRWLTDQGATHFQAVPSFLLRLLETRLARSDCTSLGSLDWILSTGEHVPHQLLELISEAEGLTARYANMYGPTECVLATWGELNRSDLGRYRLPAGRPIDGRQVFIADRRGRLKQQGFIGHITILSEHLAPGYLGQERFVEPFFGSSSEAGVGFRTGDLGRYRTDGQLEVLGRITAMVKRHGVRIEPGELETRLASLDGVDRCVVLNAAEDHGVRLIAFITGDEGKQLSEAQVRADLPTILPPQLYPDEICLVNAFPSLRNGKLDRQQLLKQWTTSRRTADSRPITTKAEQLVIEAFERTLGLSGVTLADNFFALGGHSLAATEVVDLIFQMTQVRLDPFVVFSAPVASELAALLAGTAALDDPADHADAAQSIGSRESSSLPLSVTQLPIWTSHQLSPESSRHNVTMAFVLDGSPDWHRFRSAIQNVVDTQPALRATFEVRDGVVRQTIREPRPVQLERLPQDGAPRTLTEAAGLVRELSGRAFVIEQDQLLRIATIPCVGQRWVIALATHHLVCDEESLHVMARAIEQWYNGPVVEADPRAADAAYRQFIEHSLAESDRVGRSPFWQSLFASLDLGDQSPARVRPMDSLKPVTARFEIAPQTVERIRKLAASIHTTLSMAIMTTTAEVTALHLDQPAVVVETAVSLRDGHKHDNHVGCFANTLAVPCDIRDLADFATRLSRFRNNMLAAMAHRYIDYADLRRYAGAWSPAGYPLADIVIAIHQKQSAYPRLHGLGVSAFEHHAPFLRSPLATYWRPTSDGGLSCEVEADRLLYPPDRLQAWIDDLAKGIADADLHAPLRVAADSRIAHRCIGKGGAPV